MSVLPRPLDPWAALRGLTPARIGLERAGASLATVPLLALRLAHARARDAVHAELDVPRLRDDLGGKVLCVASAAPDRRSYLLRPDLGRQLTADSATMLGRHAGAWDLVIAVVDGLSAGAVQAHAAPLLATLVPLLRTEGWRLSPVVVVCQGRVAIGDAVAHCLHAGAVLVLIGERPGLSAPDSLGAYLTWRPDAATTDADRNCFSNIRPDGQPSADAARKIARMLGRMRAGGFSGVRLKDDADDPTAISRMTATAPPTATR